MVNGDVLWIFTSNNKWWRESLLIFSEDWRKSIRRNWERGRIWSTNLSSKNKKGKGKIGVFRYGNLNLEIYIKINISFTIKI